MGNHKDEINETEMNDWFNPEKVTESFIWFCFSQLSEEQIQNRLVDFKDTFTDEFRKSLRRKNKDQLKTDDLVVRNKLEVDIEKEVEKNESRLIDDIISSMKLTKDDWKKGLDLDGISDKGIY